MVDIIRLVTVENTTNRQRQSSQQKLVFLVQVARLAYDKQVDVFWSGADGLWHSVAAHYLASTNAEQEYWQAKLTLRRQSYTDLPGDIRFALRVRSQNQEYWNNNQGTDFSSRVNSGLQLTADKLIQNLSLHPRLKASQQWLNLTVAVAGRFAAQQVVLHWSNDHWQTIHRSLCRLNKHKSTADTQIWTVKLKSAAAFRIQCAFSCQNHTREVWDNNGGENYHFSHAPLTMLVLNLHCYQEENQAAKFKLIARAIEEQAVDVVCFQEVAEEWNHGQGDWPSNSANIINQQLKNPYHLCTDWSHLGFDRYREGVAILSRYPLHHVHSRYVSESQDIYSINSRKVITAQIQVPYLGILQVFSAHLSWWEDGFQSQFNQLSAWADSFLQPDLNAILLCGDFNVRAGTTGYWQVVNGHQYQDQYLAANARGLFDKIYQVQDAHWQQYQYPADDYRIDYIFMNKDSGLAVKNAKVIFTEHDYGRVSDHCGYIMTFEPK
jgi:maltose 6'-phosphate phosphatase